MEERGEWERCCTHLGHVEFAVLYRTLREKWLAGIWMGRSGTQKKGQILKSWRGSKKLVHVLKTLDLKPSTESIFVVVKDENPKDRIYGSPRRPDFNFIKTNDPL